MRPEWQMICGGKGEVLIDFVDAGDENSRVVYEAAAEIYERGEKAWLITILDKSLCGFGLRRQQCLVKPDKTLIGKIDCDPYTLEKLISGPAKISIHAEVLEHQRFLVEPLRPAGTVYIFGAGHVSQRIAPLSASVGFRTIVLDDRAEYANRERFIEPTEVMVIESFRKLPELAIDENSYLVIVTRGHLYDSIVLKQVLRRNAAHIGMIGCCSKWQKVYEELISQGYRKKSWPRFMHPMTRRSLRSMLQELAVSIVGELIKVRASHGSQAERRESLVPPSESPRRRRKPRVVFDRAYGQQV